MFKNMSTFETDLITAVKLGRGFGQNYYTYVYVKKNWLKLSLSILFTIESFLSSERAT